jgi:hypothetical protein
LIAAFAFRTGGIELGIGQSAATATIAATASASTTRTASPTVATAIAAAIATPIASAVCTTVVTAFTGGTVHRTGRRLKHGRRRSLGCGRASGSLGCRGDFGGWLAHGGGWLRSGRRALQFEDALLGSRHHLVVFFVVLEEIRDIEEGVPAQTDVDKRRLHPGQDAGDSPFMNGASQRIFILTLVVHLDDLVVFQHRHTRFVATCRNH